MWMNLSSTVQMQFSNVSLKHLERDKARILKCCEETVISLEHVSFCALGICQGTLLDNRSL